MKDSMPTLRSRIQALLGSAIVWDNHGCLPLRAEVSVLPQLERYRAAGVSVLSLNVGFAEMSCAEHLAVLLETKTTLNTERMGVNTY